MATLRDPLFNADLNLSARKQQQLEVDDMSSLRRGWEAGRIGTELNPLRTEALNAQIADETEREQSLRAQIGQLEQRQQMYAPEVGRVEDINSIGQAGSWAAGQVGQGAASMIDPVAVSAGLSGVGRIASAIPHPVARGIGAAAQLGSMAIPAYMAKTQLTGEFIGEAEGDAELMARTSPQTLRDTAGNYGMLAALPDTVIPGIVGRQLGGFGLGKGISRMGPGAKTGLGMLGEGATEAAQGVGSQYAQGLLNPERDTSGDFMDNVNSFAGGMVGAGPFTAAGALADAGYRRTGDTAEKLGSAAGDVVDLLNENATVQKAKDAGGKLFGKAKDTVVDLASDDDGKVSAAALVENLKTVGQDIKSGVQTAMDERSVLIDQPPDDIVTDDAKAVQWLNENAPRRAQLVADKLQAMEGDPEAQAHLEAIQSPDPEQQSAAVSRAAEFVLGRMPLGRAESRAEALAQALGKAASVAGPAIGKGAVAAGKAAMGFGKAVLSGAKEGMAKKNAQTDSAPESFGAWRDRVYGVQGEAATKQVLDEAATEFSQRAELAGNYAADMSQRVNKRQPNLALLARHAAFTLADTVMSTSAKGLGQKNIKLNRLVDDLYGAFRTEAPEVLAQLGSIMGPKATPVMAYMSQELEARMLPNGFKEHAGVRNALAQQVVGLIEPEAQNRLMGQGININTPAGREQVLGLMEDYADSVGKTPGIRQAYDGVFGVKSIWRIMELLNGEAEKKEQIEVGSVVDDRNKMLDEDFDPNADDEAGESNAFELRSAEKNVVKGVGNKVFGFHATKNLRTGDETRDPFALTKKTDKDSDEVPTRPKLFMKGQQLFGGKGDAIEKKIADIRAQLQEDPNYPDHDNYDVRAKSALEVMRESSMQPGKMLQIYRDYMRMEYNNEKTPPEQRRYFAQQMRIANNMIQDGQYGSLGGNPGVPMTAEQRKGSGIAVKKGAAQNFKTTPAERRELSEAATQYFSERFVVVGEQISNRDPGKIDFAEVMAMDKEGQGLIERSRGKTVSGVFKAHPTDVQQEKLNDANLLMFKTKDGELAIPAGKLVKWVRVQRGKSEKDISEDTSQDFSNRSKDEAYLADVMEGIAALIGSGRVQGMPYKVNQFGKAESFTNGVAESLRLATTTYGAMKFGEAKRRGPGPARRSPVMGPADPSAQVDARYEEMDDSGKDPQFEVAKDQDRNAEFFTPEDRIERDLVVDGIAGTRSTRRSGKDDKREAASAQDTGGQLVTRRDRRVEDHEESLMQDERWQGPTKPELARMGKDRTDRPRMRVDVSGEVATDPKYGAKDGKIDMGGELDKDGNVTRGDDRAPLDFFPRQKDGEVADEYASQRWLSRQTNADVSIDKALAPEPKGTAASSAEFRASKITEAFLSDPAKGQEMIRSRIRMALRPAYTENRPGFDKLEGRPKLTVPGVAGKDQVVGGVHYIAPVAAFINPENLVKNNVDLEAKTIQAIQAKVANILLKGDISKTEMLKIARLMAEDPRTVTSFNVKATLERLAGGVVQGKAMKVKQEAAPEVAKAGLPKGQLTRSGGRKLNAMAVDIHRSLERDGFAATHDSPIRHEGKFDWRSHKGKGEGNAAFGAGTYLSTADGVHKSYKGVFTAFASREVDHARTAVQQAKTALDTAAEALRRKEEFIANSDRMADESQWEKQSDGSLTFDDTYVEDGEMAGDMYVLHKGPHGYSLFMNDEFTERVNDLAEFFASHRAPEHDRAQLAPLKGRLATRKQNLDAASKALTDAERAEGPLGGKSPTYEVSVNIKPEQLLDWDAPLSEQSELVQKAMAEEVLPFLTQATGALGRSYDSLVNDIESGGAPGQSLYTALTKRLGSQEKASDYLQPLGILGHKYAASGGRNDAHPNYVVYDDAKITTNYVHFSKQEGNAKVSTQAERDAATAYATKVLGPKIKVDFKDITGYSGEFIDAKNVIEISTTAAAGTLGTLYHEAMHVFFRDFVKGNPQVQAVFESLINDPKHLAKLHALLDGYPAAQAQLHSGEERLAYTYQFWKAGLLTVDAKAAAWLQKVGKFFRRVLGMVRDSERALELFEAFDNGKMSEPSAAGMVIAKALSKGSNAMKLRRQSDALLQGLASLTFPTGEIMARSVSPTARKLGTMFFTNPGEEAHGIEGQGLINAQNAVARKYNNTAHRLFAQMPESDQLAVQKYLQTGTLAKDVPLAEHREAVKTIRDLLERFHQHMTDSGMKIGKVENYYPTVWSAGRLLENRGEFITMLTTKYAEHLGDNPAKAAERIWQSLVNKEGVDAHLPAGREDGVLAPFFASQENRTLPWLEDADKEKYLDKNLVNTLTRYFHQGARASEYHRRFGENGVKLEKMLDKINVELSKAGKEKMKRGEIKDEAARVKWVARQMRDITQATGAMEGTLGKDVSPNMRKFNSWMAVYQNIRLLPMSLFSSFVDPLGIVARGAPFQAAYESFVYGMKEVFHTWANAFRDLPPERAKDKWRELAEHVGATEIAMFGHLVSDQYSSVYMTPGAKKLNDKMFVFNGMEAWNRGMRVMATKWAVRFIEQHAALPDKTHSARWLKELGLAPGMIHLNAEGELITSRHELVALKGMSIEQATKAMEPIHQALVRWTESAVLTPNAAQRPGWASDPHYASMFHLKQFSYSFHQTILKRAANEFEHGNIAPVGALTAFVPAMIVSDMMKGLIQGGGSLPPYMAGMDAGDWIVHGFQRAGLAGIGNIGMDASTDLSSLGGPAIEQMVDAMRDDAGKTLLNAAPLHALYANAVR